MKGRKRVSKGRGKREFRNTANKTHPANMHSRPLRGGGRL